MLLSRILKTELINWQQAQWLQNDDLKKLEDGAMERLKESLVKNNFVMPFHVWEDEDSIIWILDGHHRQKALQALLADGIQIPNLLHATFIDCQDRQQAAKLVLIFSSIYAKLQQDGLFTFLENFQLKLDEFKLELDLPDFSLPRFEQKFTPQDIFQDEPDTGVDDPEEILVKKGDHFILGKHELHCGDCFDMKNWNRMLDNGEVDMVFTDPPYNLGANEIGNKGRIKHNDFAMAKGEMTEVEFKDFLKKIMEQSCKLSKDGALHYICMDFRHIWHMTQAGFEVYNTYQPKQLCVWNKDTGANGSFYRAKHELIFIYKYGTAKHTSYLELQDRIRYNVWDYPGANSLANPDWEEIRHHPTPKPIAMVANAMIDVTNEGDIVADFFLGSGTTLMAAEESGRICLGTEIEPKYCQHIIKRYKNLCTKLGRPFHFTHANGELTAENF